MALPMRLRWIGFAAGLCLALAVVIGIPTLSYAFSFLFTAGLTLLGYLIGLTAEGSLQ